MTVSHENANLTFDITSEDGFVIVDHPEVRFDMRPEEAEWMASVLLKHAALARAARDAKVRRTSGGKR